MKIGTFQLRRLRPGIALAILVGLTQATGPTALEAGPSVPFCTPDPDPPAYYAFPLVTTKKIPGTAYVKGTGEVTFAASPYGVSIAPDGSYAYDLHLSFEGLEEPGEGSYTAWVTTPQLDRIRRLGPLEDGMLRGRVTWNKFLVVITLETSEDPTAERWSGPVAFRGMSRSGMMHTMAGHGPFQQENCAAYGYAN